MSNSHRKKQAAEEHNRRYAEKESAPNNTELGVNVGNIGHVDRKTERALMRAVLGIYALSTPMGKGNE